MAGYRLIIVDDHPLFRDALSQALSTNFQDLEIAEFGSLDELSQALESNSDVDLILLDLAMPGIKGLSGLMYLRAQYPEIPTVIVSANEDTSAIRRSLEFGASGFVPKSLPVETIRQAIKIVLEGGIWSPPNIDLDSVGDEEADRLIARLSTLTPQQVRVLIMLSEGLLNKQIAYDLGVSEATIKAHVSAILQKLGVDSRTQAVIAVNKIDPMHWQNKLKQ